MEVKWCFKMHKVCLSLCLSVCPSESDCSKVLSRKICFILREMKLNPRFLGSRNSKLRLVFCNFFNKKRFFYEKKSFLIKFDRKVIGGGESESEICF